MDLTLLAYTALKAIQKWEEDNERDKGLADRDGDRTSSIISAEAFNARRAGA